MTALIWATDMLGSKTLTLGPRSVAAVVAAAAGASARAARALPVAATSATTTRTTIRTDRRIFVRPLSRERSLHPTGSPSAASRSHMLQIGNRNGSVRVVVHPVERAAHGLAPAPQLPPAVRVVRRRRPAGTLAPVGA